jgi:hypothetical protein
MKISELLKETASCGSTSAGSIATVNATGTPPKGQFFGGDPSSSIYGVIHKNRKNRKKPIKEGLTKNSRGTYLFIYNPDVGLFIRKGEFSNHGRLFGKVFDRVYPKIQFDEFDRGYIVVSIDDKSLLIMPTSAREYFDYDIEKIFENKYSKKYKIKMSNRFRSYYLN